MRRLSPQLMLTLLVALTLVLPACRTAPATQADRDQLHDEVQTTMQSFIRQDPTIEDQFRDAYGFAVFPNVGKGGAIVGGGFGRGEVYEQGELIGYASLTQGTFGATLGGRSFRQVVFFEDREALEHMLDGRLSFTAGASAVAMDQGAARQARYRDGVLVFVQDTGGLMVDAAVGGQNFEFYPLRTIDDPEAEIRPPEEAPVPGDEPMN